MWAACVALAALSATADLDQLLAQAAAAKARGAWAESLASMERAHAIHPAPELMNNIGWLLETLGRYRDAAAAYRRVVDDGSASPELRALDRERLEVLSPKLDRGHLVETRSCSAGRRFARVNGRPSPRTSR
jgi:tetratricopeptide (TPR) repeat protein